ncbi:MAG TPA: hypothetical protein VHY30_07495 [Verrucomicrobiae bacterium]|jgi:hypothetical protein|nr:hypothetical protein [Verrucomicrobiae bacterium]
MTLLQTRVEDKIARRLEKVARQRGETIYSFLQRVVVEATVAIEPESWDSHWKKVKALNLKQARKTVAELREESGER